MDTKALNGGLVSYSQVVQGSAVFDKCRVSVYLNPWGYELSVLAVVRAQ